jgi:hypothetical protein
VEDVSEITVRQQRVSSMADMQRRLLLNRFMPSSQLPVVQTAVMYQNVTAWGKLLQLFQLLAILLDLQF